METDMLIARAYTGEADLEKIVAFLNLVEAYDLVGEGSSVAELREEFNEPSFDPVSGLRLYENAHNELVGFAQLYVPEDTADNEGSLWFKVHPAHRTAQIEPAMFAWADEQLRARGRIQLRVTVRDKEIARQALIERQGFTPVRYFLRMRRALSAPLPVPVFPLGYRLHAGDHDAQTWADLYNDSFADHYNFHPHDAAFVRHWQNDPDYRSDLNLVAIAPDGTFAAFAWCHIHAERNKRAGRLDGTIGTLGTRPGHRRIGLGRAMLLAGMHRLRDVGMSNADLGVDASSPTGANALYESVGFETTYSHVLYSRAVDR